ncbi:SGNH/GDSL hydrolase family protein [Kitasatospora sp. NBC_00374]|uniref:SGNH/GDSL hydrolase family protein n=1 Tax=Kitasatospora sp. NBC_00374 TaxID=2975964 RepID=UPI003252688D
MTNDRSTETVDPYCLSDEAAVDLLSGTPWKRFAVMGDSFAAGVGGPCPGYADISWPERVAQALRGNVPDLAYLNTGEVGLRTRQVRQTQLAKVLEFGPDLVNVATGGNDLFGPNPDLDAVEADLEEIYAALTARGAHVFAFTVADIFEAFPDFAEFRALVDRLNGRIRGVAERHGATLVDMWEHPVRTSPTLMSADGIHFSMEGHAVLAGEIIRSLSTATPATAPGRSA